MLGVAPHSLAKITILHKIKLPQKYSFTNYTPPKILGHLVTEQWRAGGALPLTEQGFLLWGNNPKDRLIIVAVVLGVAAVILAILVILDHHAGNEHSVQSQTKALSPARVTPES